METVRFAVEDGIATLTLDSPARKNALSIPMRNEIGEAVRRVGADDSVRALILTAAGTDFSSGGDISSMQVEINPRKAGGGCSRYTAGWKT